MQHRTWFGVHGSSANEDIINLICHVASYDLFIEVSYEFMGRSSLRYVTILMTLVTISIVIVEIIFSRDLS